MGWESAPVLPHILQKTKLREVKRLVQGHTAGHGEAGISHLILRGQWLFVSCLPPTRSSPKPLTHGQSRLSLKISCHKYQS